MGVFPIGDQDYGAEVPLYVSMGRDKVRKKSAVFNTSL